MCLLELAHSVFVKLRAILCHLRIIIRVSFTVPTTDCLQSRINNYTWLYMQKVTMRMYL